MSSGHDVQEDPTVGLPRHGVEGSARRGKGRSEGEGVVNPEGPRVPCVRVVVVERVRNEIPRRRNRGPPLGRELAAMSTRRYADPDPKGPRTWVVKVKTVCHPPLRTWSTQLFREIDVANGFAISIHSGFGRGETSLITAFVAAWMEIGNRVTAASGRARSYSSRQSEA